MKFSIAGLFVVACILTCISIGTSEQDYKTWPPTIPRTWDDEAVLSMELPLPSPAASVKYITSDYYYRMPVRPVYRTYDVYYPEKEPAGYMDRLAKQEPEVLFDASKLKTEQDWIRAGELVFDAPIEFVTSSEILFSEVRGVSWYTKNQVLVTRDGVLPNMRYVVREKGKVELGILACAMCHTRVMPDGTIIKGAQGNFPDDRAFGYEIRMDAAQSKDKDKALQDLRSTMRRSYAAPWVPNDLNASPDRMSLEEIVSVLEAIPPGACARQGSSIFYPAHIPDLIGLKDRRFFDATGHVRHRSIADVMRYAALNQGADMLSSYAGFRPAGELPDPSTESRYSDEQLYALALYLYSVTPPPNPNKHDDLAARGKVAFEKAGCPVCHPAPLYTNNELTPVEGFDAPVELDRKDVLNMPVDTDPFLTLNTRRGSGYYKVPSLKGVWYRGPFEHNGTVATLEDWFDPRRLQDDFVRSGGKKQAVKGHAFGLSLSKEDREALVAFLKTL